MARLLKHAGRSLIFALIILCVSGCGTSPQRILTIYAAASLTDVFNDLATGFEAQRPNTRIIFNFAATSTLRAQLEQGAHADLFVAANERHMKEADEAGVLGGRPALFANNRLAIIIPAGSTLVKSLVDLATPDLKLFLVSKEVPIGEYVQQAMNLIEADPNYGPQITEQIMENVVGLGLNARNATLSVQLGEADATIAYVTDANNPKFQLSAIPLIPRHSPSVKYLIAIVDESRAKELATEFIDYVLSNRGNKILGQHGFLTP